MTSSRVSGGVLETGYTVKFITSELPVTRSQPTASSQQNSDFPEADFWTASPTRSPVPSAHQLEE